MGFLMILLYLSPIVYFLYVYINRKYSYWEKKGVNGPKFPENIWPLGNLMQHFRKNAFDLELYNTKNYGKVYGRYVGNNPALNITDIELVKQVLVKDFHLFVNRREFKVLDKHWKTNLFFSQDEDWKRIRSIVTPAFTSGKLRRMYPLLKDATNKLEKYFSGVVNEGNNSVDIKKVISGFTIDVIASTSFGTDTDANGDRVKLNPFLHHGQRLFQKLSPMRLLFLITMPMSIIKFFDVRHAFEHDSFNFIVNVVQTMIKRAGRRDDLITLMKEANIADEELKNLNLNNLTASSEVENAGESGEKKPASKIMKTLTDEEIVGQSIIFFVAGFETTSSAITSTLFQLAKYPDIQQRLYDEITEKLSDIDADNLDQYYETIMNRMPYLDAVIKETLRMYPPVTRLERRFGGESGYKLGNVSIEKGMLIEIPTVSIHYDPDYWVEPMKYDPSRFMPENKHKLVPYTYLSFGQGSRNCVGMRFAYQEAKICVASLLQKFRFERNEKTPENLPFLDKRIGLLMPSTYEINVNHR